MSTPTNPFFAASTPSKPAPVAALKDSFDALATTGLTGDVSPAASGKFFLGGVPSSSTSLSGCTIGSSFVFITKAEDICGGSIGAGGRFCCKRAMECKVVSHGRKKLDDIKPGLYLKGINDDAYTTPFTGLGQIGSEAVEFLLGQEYETQTARGKIDLINEYEGFLQTAGEVQNLFNSKPSADSITPRKRKLAQTDLKQKFEAVLSSVSEEEGLEKEDVPFQDYMKELNKTVQFSREDMSFFSDNLQEVSSQIGIPTVDCPPSLWVAYLEHKAEIADINQLVKNKADISLEKQLPNLETYVTTLVTRMDALEANVTKAFHNVRDEFVLVKANLQSTTGNPTTLPTSSIPISNLESRMGSLENALTSFLSGDIRHVMAVRVGKYHFQSLADVGAWADKFLPPTYPFGPFVDIYSFLERVKSSRDIGELISAVSDMDTRKKVNVSSDEATVVEAFQHPLPRCFRGNSSAAGIGSWLPGLKNKTAWENKSGTHGVKVAIRDNMEGIRGRIDAVITQRLGIDPSTGKSYDEATALARELLSDTVTFLTSLIAFMSTTHNNLVTAGYPEESAWNLVTKLVYRLFATDCYHDKRGVATELMDSNDHRTMAIGILWATFATHQVMKSYLKYSFSDHPSISGEYTRFLVAHAGVAKVERATKSIETLTALVSALEKKVETADKKATTASSKADEAIKSAKKARMSSSE